MIKNEIIRDYEVICAFNADNKVFLSEKDNVIAKMKELDIELVREDDMGVRNFAFQIKGHYQGHYCVFIIKGKPYNVKEIRNNLKYSENLFRILIIKKD